IGRARTAPGALQNAFDALLSLEPVFVTRGPVDRYVAMLTALLTEAEHVEVNASRRARALLSRGAADRHEERRTDLERAASLAAEAGDTATEAFALVRLGWNRTIARDLDQAASCFAKARAVLDGMDRSGSPAEATRLEALYERHLGYYLAQRAASTGTTDEAFE